MPTKRTVHASPSPDAIREEIKTMAQDIYSKRQAKQAPGDQLSDWLAAEAKVKAKHKL